MKFHFNLPPLGPFVLHMGSPIGFCPLIIRSTSKLSSALSTPVGSEINKKCNKYFGIFLTDKLKKLFCTHCGKSNEMKSCA